MLRCSADHSHEQAVSSIVCLSFWLWNKSRLSYVGFPNKEKELPMSKMVKIISAFAICAGFSAITVMPAHALSVIAPAYEGQAQTENTYSNPPVAFTGSKGEAANGASFSLSEQEIMHVRWCAQKYTSYHATDNTIEAAHGARTACKSPY
ncbi:BA14K family protein [Agrobacterium sp. BA1120]|uniref:BA14K family protein n=1 Tax=Agrobacterium sp. BA1120 TaxID=3228927 RepID=UPI00336A56D8